MSYSSFCKSIIPFGRLASLSAIAVSALTISSADAAEYEVEIIAEGLAAPSAIATKSHRTLYFSEVPTPGVFGTDGGENTVKKLDLRTGRMVTISEGEPYPINIALGRRGQVYWTCQTAGVILQYNRHDGKSFFLPADPGADDAQFLLSPTGITVDRNSDVLFTELPMPGTVGPNMVSVSDGENITHISNDEPAPTDIVISFDGTAYWTCNTAGVIIRRSRAGVISILKTGLESPTGIALDRWGRKLYYTELPTPGVSGDEGGTNRVVELDLYTMKTTNVSEGFPLPKDVAVAPNGNVYWTCTKAGVIACAKPKVKKKRHSYFWW